MKDNKHARKPWLEKLFQNRKCYGIRKGDTNKCHPHIIVCARVHNKTIDELGNQKAVVAMSYIVACECSHLEYDS